MNSKLIVACFIACTSYQYSSTMEQHTPKKLSQESYDALLAKANMPEDTFMPSGLTLEDDIARCNTLNKKVQKFTQNQKLSPRTDFKALEQAATDALIATIQYLNNPALDPNTAQDQNAKTAIMIKRLDPTALSNMVALTSLRMKAACLQTPEGLERIAQYKKEEEEKRLLVLRRALSLGLGAGCMVLLHRLHNSAL